MSNCFSSQAEYDDHDFKDGVCKDCGQTSKADIMAMAAQIKDLEAKVTELTERNRRIANQAIGLTDRVNDSLGEIVKQAYISALEEAATALEGQLGVTGAPTDLHSTRAWLRSRAKTMEKS